ncbi:hypothetical protein D9M68_647600 [compost metagenome]
MLHVVGRKDAFSLRGAVAVDEPCGFLLAEAAGDMVAEVAGKVDLRVFKQNARYRNDNGHFKGL